LSYLSMVYYVQKLREPHLEIRYNSSTYLGGRYYVEICFE
jgi:hypothetical protein